MSTRDYRWLHEQDWESAQRAAYAQMRQAPALGAFSALPFDKGKRRTPAKVYGRWVLEFPQGTPRAAVEVQAYTKSFTTLHVILSPFHGETKEEGWADVRGEALAMFLSGLMVGAQPDVLKLFPITQRVGREIELLGWGEATRIWSPYKLDALLNDPSRAPGETMSSLVIDPHEWWTTEQGKRSKESVSYLEKRVEAAKRAEGPPKKGKFSRGFLSRLLTWR